jgi:hypothetical protein
LAFRQKGQRFSAGQSGDGGIKEQLIEKRGLWLTSKAHDRNSNHSFHMKANRISL